MLLLPQSTKVHTMGSSKLSRHTYCGCCHCYLYTRFMRMENGAEPLKTIKATGNWKCCLPAFYTITNLAAERQLEPHKTSAGRASIRTKPALLPPPPKRYLFLFLSSFQVVLSVCVLVMGWNLSLYKPNTYDDDESTLSSSPQLSPSVKEMTGSMNGFHASMPSQSAHTDTSQQKGHNTKSQGLNHISSRAFEKTKIVWMNECAVNIITPEFPQCLFLSFQRVVHFNRNYVSGRDCVYNRKADVDIITTAHEWISLSLVTLFRVHFLLHTPTCTLRQGKTILLTSRSSRQEWISGTEDTAKKQKKNSSFFSYFIQHFTAAFFTRPVDSSPALPGQALLLLTAGAAFWLMIRRTGLWCTCFIMTATTTATQKPTHRALLT